MLGLTSVSPGSVVCGKNLLDLAQRGVVGSDVLVLARGCWVLGALCLCAYTKPLAQVPCALVAGDIMACLV